MRRIFSSFLGYVVVSVVSVVASLSLVTRQFPPPVEESIRVLKELKETVDGTAATNISKSIKERDAFFMSLDSGDVLAPEKIEPDHVISTESLLADNKALKYENLILKSRLDNCSKEEEK